MAEKQNTPEIRFEGFTDPWEQRKFSELYVINNERNEGCEFGYDKTLSVATMTYNGGNGAADNSLSTYKVVRVGDIAFEGHTNKEHAYGRFVLNDAGNGLMSPRFSCLRPIVEQRYSFWKHYIPRESMMRPVLVNATKSGTMMNELVPADLMRESILVPALYEQEAIGRFFKQLDDLITLHQRKYDKLCTVKKSMLDKMFPKPGETEPEIRFEGFTDPWEQRKFSELYVINNERNEGCEFGYDKTLSVATMTYNGGNGAADNSLSTYKVVRVGDIAFEGHTNKEHAYGRFVLNDAGDGLMSPRFSCLRPIVEQRYSFWKHYIPRESMMRPVLVNATKSGTMMNELVPADLMRESILVPALYEQEAIGRFFKQLDDLITLHQRKLDLLKNTKKSLLDKMFV
ncbi:hypothetical protein [Olsenella uli]|uniref:hypothetical protein n=1 Tax=Olsenella uli TaxID=133926 RepID=UPI003D7BB076